MHMLCLAAVVTHVCADQLYCSHAQAHSSCKKATMIAGITNLRVLKTEESAAWALQADTLQQAIEQDLQAGLVPFYVFATAGTTSTATVDDLRGLATVSKPHNIW